MRNNCKTFCLFSCLLLHISLRFKDKTKNDWYQRKDFEKVPGKYDLLAIDYGAKVVVQLFKFMTDYKNYTSII